MSANPENIKQIIDQNMQKLGFTNGGSLESYMDIIVWATLIPNIGTTWRT